MKVERTFTTEELDSMFTPSGYKVHPLELAARICMAEAAEARNIQLALLANRCAIAIRNMPDWRVYEPIA